MELVRVVKRCLNLEKQLLEQQEKVGHMLLWGKIRSRTKVMEELIFIYMLCWKQILEYIDVSMRVHFKLMRIETSIFLIRLCWKTIFSFNKLRASLQQNMSRTNPYIFQRSFVARIVHLGSDCSTQIWMLYHQYFITFGRGWSFVTEGQTYRLAKEELLCPVQGKCEDNNPSYWEPLDLLGFIVVYSVNQWWQHNGFTKAYVPVLKF